MFSGEPFPPYSPPAMVEYFLTGREVHFWKGKDFPERYRIDYRQGTQVTAVRPDRHIILLEDGERLQYDRLVLATGGRLYSPLEGEDKLGVYNFKSLTAAEDLIRRVKKGKAHSALIIGAGFIGVEIGILLAELGIQVTQLVRSRVMRQMLDSETAEIVHNTMQKRGINILTGSDAVAVAFVGKRSAEGVKTKSDEVLKADLLVAATGIKPNTEYLKGSGIEMDWGVLVNDHLQTNIPDIYAAGDVIETTNRITGTRSAHPNFPNAVAQGKVVAYNIMGWDIAYEGAESMNSLKHLGLPIMAVGQMEGEELRVKRGDNLRKLYLKDERIVGFRLVGDISGAGIYRSLMNRQAEVSGFKNQLLEPGFGMGYIENLALEQPILTPVR
jgi:NAD(P)H-nitrite reductase large subunit